MPEREHFENQRSLPTTSICTAQRDSFDATSINSSEFCLVMSDSHSIPKCVELHISL